MQKWITFGQSLRALLLTAVLSVALVGCDKAPKANALLMPEIYAPAMGSVAINPRGHLILVSFFDYTSLDARQIFPDLLQMAHENSNLRFVTRVLPILGDQSVMVARLAIAAQFQGKQVRFSDGLMMSPKQLSKEQVLGIAEAAGLNVTKLEADVNKPQVVAQIDENISIAHRLGIEQVPAYVVAYADEMNHVLSANLVQGNVSIEQLKQLLAELDEKAKQS